MKQLNYKEKTLQILRELCRDYPKQLFATHLGMALADYPNFDIISDKELFHAFEKYQAEKNLDISSSLIAFNDLDDLNLDDDDEY